ncbi:MAG: hypothetical protein HGA45_04315 [Chloroflexales bacterium]|nr:hypothetical protein [Chloroflexales bacterium]
MWIARSLCLLALLAAALLTSPSARAAGPSLTPNAPGVTAGDFITFSAEGFTPKERIAVWATAPDQAVFSSDYAFANDLGRAQVSFRVPAGAIGGTWAITAYGDTSHTPAVAYFEVAGRPAESAERQAWAAPESGPAGSTFRFAAVGFDRRERVSYWFTAPDGTIFATFSQSITADSEGRVDISWRAPDNAPRGAWVVTIQGVESGVARGIAFYVQ